MLILELVVGLFTGGFVIGLVMVAGLYLEEKTKIPHLLPILLILLIFVLVKGGIAGIIALIAVLILMIIGCALYIGGMLGAFELINRISEAVSKKKELDKKKNL